MDRILLIDDEEIANYLNELIIKKHGRFKTVEVCESGVQALQLLQKKIAEQSAPPDLILLDINMPKMNGFEFLDEYARLDTAFTDQIKVVMLTSSLSEKDKQRALEHKCVAGFCIKPLSIAVVDNLLQDLQTSSGK